MKDRDVGPTHPSYNVTLGATCLKDGRHRFLVWAPKARRVDLKIVGDRELLLPMVPGPRGYYELATADVAPGTRYLFRLDDQRDLPDPASRSQPEGVHQASEVALSHFDWEDDAWHGLPFSQYIAYELHVGTFSLEGTFDGVAGRLDQLVELGVTAVELMPVAQFPGNRNWGYDGVHPFAVQNSYGGVLGLKRLVNACHRRGLAVVMDVVYNHLGPEGNYFSDFGHYFTERYQTAWGAAINFDGPDSDEVRRYFIENAMYWIREFHIDALRLDAVHAIFDFSAQPFLQELSEAVRVQGELSNRRVYTIAESDLNDARLVRSAERGGVGVDAQWCDDLHHALHSELTGERDGYYADFRGFDDIVKAFRDGYVLDGRFCPSRRRRHGNSARDIRPTQLVVCSQNHDQTGNRLFGERLSELVTAEKLKLAAGVILLSPYQPLLFMGEEYGETARFQYFVSHTDRDLLAAVRQGRRAEFASFQWQEEPPDPGAEETFIRSRLNHQLRHGGYHQQLWQFYRELIRLRKRHAALAIANRRRMSVTVPIEGRVMMVSQWTEESDVATIFHFGSEPITANLSLTEGVWTTLLSSSVACWGGPDREMADKIDSCGQVPVVLSPYAVNVLERQNVTTRQPNAMEGT